MNFEKILNEEKAELDWTSMQTKRVHELKEQGWDLKENDEKGNPIITKEGSSYDFAIHVDGTFEVKDLSGE